MPLLSFRDLDLSFGALHAFGILLFSYAILKYLEARRSPLNAFPTVGYSGVLTSYITAIKWIFKSRELLQEGYDKYPGIPFKVATVSNWIVILTGEQHIDDIRKAPDDVLDFNEAAREQIKADYTLGPGLFVHPHQVTTIRSPVTRNLGTHFGEIRDEIVESFNHYIPATEDWTMVPAFETMKHIVCRAINRYFVGLPLCRDPGYCSFVEQITTDVILGAVVITCLPNFMKPTIGRYLSTVPRRIKRVISFLGPMIDERLAQRSGGHSADEANDIVAWLLETATHDYHYTVRDLAMRVCMVYFGAVNTTTGALTQGLYDLAVHPEYVKALREEVEALIAEHGWTKTAIQRMRKLDSFLKESLRLHPPTRLSVLRKTRTDWTLSDGTVVPSGTLIAVATDAMNKAKKLFEDPTTFKGFRFLDVSQEDEGSEFVKHQLITLDTNVIVFGYGRHACPGRFLAVYVIKAILAHIILDYDVQLENRSMERPPDTDFDAAIFPNSKAKVMFRRRRVHDPRIL